MRDENIKEQLSRYAFCLMASRAGFKIRNFNLDDGVDLGLEKTISYALNGDGWTYSFVEPVDIQLKATTESQVSVEGKFLKFDLKRKNFNDLIARKKLRRQGQKALNMLLVLMVMPDNPLDWLKVNPKDKSIHLESVFYWYQPPGFDFSENKNWQSIEVPLKNAVDLNFFQEFDTLFY